MRLDKYRKAALTLALAAVIPVAAFAPATAVAAGEAASLDADTVEYDMSTGLVTAEGDVLMKRGTSRVSGERASYNTKTQAGSVIGNVIAVHDDMRLTCAQVTSDGSGHMQATGGVHGTQADKSFAGEQVDYYPEDKYVLMATGGTLTSADGTFTADHLEGWLAEEHYVGKGNAHVVSPARGLEAGGDQLDYYGQGDGKAVMTGNAWAVQNNNTMKSNRLTIYLAKDGQAAVK